MNNNYIEIHSYYVCDEGNIKGIELYTQDFTMIKGPFINYDMNKRILTNKNNIKVYLPKGRADLCMFPPVYQRTCNFLEKMISK